jgi:hypothetical protein
MANSSAHLMSQWRAWASTRETLGGMLALEHRLDAPH